MKTKLKKIYQIEMESNGGIYIWERSRNGYIWWWYKTKHRTIRLNPLSKKDKALCENLNKQLSELLASFKP